MTTMKLGEYQRLQREYEEARARGETWDECTACGEPVRERDANYDFYAGTGTVLHGQCVRLHLLRWEAPGWWKLAWDDYCDTMLDRRWARFPTPVTPEGIKGVHTVSTRALRAKNAADHPGDSFFNRPVDPPEYEDFMDLALYAMGVPLELFGEGEWE